MPQQCSICKHEARTKIDKALLLPGASLRGIARTFRVSEDALSRHIKKGHIPHKTKEIQAAQDIVEADDLLKEFQIIQGHQQTIFREERANENNRLALEALRDQSKTVELKGKVLGSFIKDKPTEPTTAVREITDEEVERRAREILAKRK